MPLRMLNCHCRDCQLASGGAYSPTLIVKADAFRLVIGEPKRFSRTADSGNIAHRDFCGDCGTPLFAHSSARPDSVGVRAATLDDPTWYVPAANVWTDRAQPWDYLAPELPKFGKNRPRSTVETSMTDPAAFGTQLDAMLAAPDHHDVLIENPRVRVLDTRLAPGERTPVHEHQWPAALYILGWSDFIRYSPAGEVLVDSRSISPKPLVGQAIWSAPLPPHYVHNVGDSDLHIIAVELKGDDVRD